MSAEVRALLRERYAAPAWAFLEEVRNGTGYGRTVRTADALAMSLYPSAGLHLHGFEIKVSRADWLRELKAPDKADEISRYCNFWWIVAPPDVVQVAELPPKWGLMLAGKKLRVEVAAPALEPQPPSLPMLAAIMRAFWSDATDEGRIAEAEKRGLKRGERQASQVVERNARGDLLNLQQRAESILRRATDAMDRWDQQRSPTPPTKET